jgi:hypothetical protein
MITIVTPYRFPYNLGNLLCAFAAFRRHPLPHVKISSGKHG